MPLHPNDTVEGSMVPSHFANIMLQENDYSDRYFVVSVNARIVPEIVQKHFITCLLQFVVN
jgi:sulfur carrier protein ThiS